MPQITYLMGTDLPGGANAYFSEAKGYFDQQAPSAQGNVIVAPPAGAAASLEWLFDDLRAKVAAGSVFEQINIVSHATGFSELQFGLLKPRPGPVVGSREPTITSSMLINAVAASTQPTPIIKVLGPPAVTERTHLKLFGCDVGKDEAFIRNFALLFGNPADITAPMRVAVFRHSGTTFTHDLARTWSVLWPSRIVDTTSAQWPAVRQAFLTAVDAKFGQAAADASPDPLARDSFVAMIKTVASTSTLTSRDTFFFGETFAEDPNLTVNRQSVAVPSDGTVDDMSVVNRITPADYSKSPTVWIARLAILAQIWTSKELAKSSNYRTVTIAAERKPSPGPKAVPDGGAPPAGAVPQHSLWEQTVEEFLAAGGHQGDLDTLIAGLTGPSTDDAQQLSDAGGPLMDNADSPTVLPQGVRG